MFWKSRIAASVVGAMRRVALVDERIGRQKKGDAPYHLAC
jgi:hypothetical protein